MPARRATSETVRGLSPEMTLVRTPCWAKYAKVCGASGRILLDSRMSASGIISAVSASSSSFPSYKASSSTRQPLADHSSACGKNRSFSGQAASRISGAPSRYVSSSWNDTPPYFFADRNGMAAMAVCMDWPVK